MSNGVKVASKDRDGLGGRGGGGGLVVQHTHIRLAGGNLEFFLVIIKV